jgi:hypothetical protein
MTYAFLPQEALGQWTTNANDINNTTCNVGVGTATPVEKLTINGDQHQPRILARPGLDVQNPVSRPQSTGSPPAGADRRD